MNVLFLTLISFNSLQERNIYTDLLREFVKNGHTIYAISPIEKRYNKKTHIIREGNSTILRLRIGNTQKTNIIEKGISTIMIEPTVKDSIKRYFSDIRFDLILYSTPPITFVSAIEYVKRRDNAKAYLLLKDIFPQNAIDVGMMTKHGIKGLIYKYFCIKEKKLYRISNWIGCMSQANVNYINNHHKDIDTSIIEVCPNSVDIRDKSVDLDEKKRIREKYRIPIDKKVFVYGGNLGKPQDIPFIVKCLQRCKSVEDVFFLIVGDGTEYDYLEKGVYESNQKNVLLLKRLPKEEYDTLVGACDVGLIFLDHRFTIPNFPSRLLSYMQAKIPILAITDKNTDIGEIIIRENCGWWCESDDVEKVYNLISLILNGDLEKMGENGFQYMIKQYSSKKSYQIIISHFNNK